MSGENVREVWDCSTCKQARVQYSHLHSRKYRKKLVYINLIKYVYTRLLSDRNKRNIS